MFKEVHNNVISALFSSHTIDEDTIDLSKITTELSRKKDSGDIATNVAMVVAKQIGMEPRTLAEDIVPYLEHYYGEGNVEVAGPGFINITMEPMWWLGNLMHIMKEESDYGSSYLPMSPKVNVEFVSANPTGPLHIGHARGAIFGDVLCSIYEKIGIKATREYYVNDAGGQIDKLVESIYHEYHCQRGMEPYNLNQIYSGVFITYLAEKWIDMVGNAYILLPSELALSPDKYKEPLRKFALPLVMDKIKDDLKSLGIKHDVFTYESDIVKNGGVNAALNKLREKQLTYKGVLSPPKGKEDMDYDSRKQLLFKSTKFGDDIDRPFKKADGSWTYFATDVANHLNKLERGYNYMVNVWGADHAGYVLRVQAAVAALSDKHAIMDVSLCQMVNLIDNGVKLKQSKREGNFITVEEVVNRVGKDALRFTMMTSKSDAHMDFDFQKVVEENKNNMVYYVQYAHARAHSVMNKADERPEYEDVCVETLERLTDEAEMGIVKHLSTWKDVLHKSAKHKEPHRIAYYLYELAGLFHSLQSNKDPKLRFLIAGDDELQMARLILVQCVAHVIKSGLDVLGVSAPMMM